MPDDAVIIIESPNKCKKIAQYSGIPTLATVGHFMGLPDKELGVDLSNDYAPAFRPTSDMHKRLKDAARGKVVYLAPDPDREGFAIATHAYELVRGVAREVRRVEIHEITEGAVKKALAASIPFKDTNFGLYEAFLGRRVFDRVIGWGLSGLVSKELGIWGLSAGRVQSCALRLIVDREQEVQGFTSKAFYRLRVEGLCSPENGFWLEHTTKKFETVQVVQFAKAKAVSAGFGTITSVEKSMAKEAAKAPFTTASLTATANKRLGLSLKQTMDLAQKLFEGGFITYVRTDCVTIAAEKIDEIRAVIAAQFGPQSIPNEPVIHKSKDSQAEAHEAIRPTIFPAFADLDQFSAKILADGLGEGHVKLFRLIYLRTLASQMVPAEFECLKILADFGGDAFQATGRVQIKAGWKALYESPQGQAMQLEPEEEPGADEDGANQAQKLPPVEQGQKLTIGRVEIPEGKTKPPARFTEGTLVEKLEGLGIGRPATYAATLAKLFYKHYIELGTGKLKNRLIGLELGAKIVEALKAHHAFVVDYNLTRQIEEQLDQVEARKLAWQKVVRDYHAFLDFIDPSKITFTASTPRALPKRVSLGSCPLCKGAIIANESLPYWGCDRYAPENGSCAFRLYKNTFGYKLSAAQAKMLFAGKETALLKLKRKDGSAFEASLRLNTEGRIEPVFNKGGNGTHAK